MSIYARIEGDFVAETFSPPEGMTLADCFHPDLLASWQDITNASPRPEPGWKASQSNSAWAYAPPDPPPAPTLAEQAAGLLSQGLSVKSTSTPDINGVYSVDPTAQGRLAAVSTYILVNGKFPGGRGSYPWIDTEGNAHTFPNTALFQHFASAAADYVSALDLIAASGTGTLPPAEVTIE